jgi:hypothetical protein
MPFRRKEKRRRTLKKKKKSQKTRHKRLRVASKPPNALINFSPISSPGPNSPQTPNSPITRRAKELASLYPNTKTMVKRSSSFNNGMTTNNFYEEFKKVFPEQNGPPYS